MRYMGGKKRIAMKFIAPLIIDVAKRGELPRIEDRFCGAMSVSHALWRLGRPPALAIDAFLPLVSMLRAVRDGWDPPPRPTREEHAAMGDLWRRKHPSHGDLAQRDPTDPMVAFLGFFCSFGGNFFHGWASEDLRCKAEWAIYPSATSAKDLVEMRPMLREVPIECGDCFARMPRSPSLLYFDPPYRGTEDFPHLPHFDSDAFFAIAGEESDRHAILVSEFEAPRGWRCIAENCDKKRGLMAAGKVERVFAREGGRADFISRRK